MLTRFISLSPWLIGLICIGVLFLWVDLQHLHQVFAQVGFSGILVWLAITLSVRMLHAEITVLPLSVFSARMRRIDAFWIGWLRTFANQILPLAGLVAYAKAVRDRAGLSWSEVTALATPQFFIASLALSLLGLLAVFGATPLDPVGWVLLAGYTALLVFSLGLILHAPFVIRACPKILRVRLLASADAFSKISENPKLLGLLLLSHLGVIVLRAGRLWLLFELAGLPLDWHTAFILGVIAESTLIIQLTPGGLGLREGSILAGAVWLGVDTSLAASVAIIDRLLVVATTSIFVLPAMYFLWKKAPS